MNVAAPLRVRSGAAGVSFRRRIVGGEDVAVGAARRTGPSAVPSPLLRLVLRARSEIRAGLLDPVRHVPLDGAPGSSASGQPPRFPCRARRPPPPRIGRCPRPCRGTLRTSSELFGRAPEPPWPGPPRACGAHGCPVHGCPRRPRTLLEQVLKACTARAVRPGVRGVGPDPALLPGPPPRAGSVAPQPWRACGAPPGWYHDADGCRSSFPELPGAWPVSAGVARDTRAPGSPGAAASWRAFGGTGEDRAESCLRRSPKSLHRHSGREERRGRRRTATRTGDGAPGRVRPSGES